MSKPIYTPCGGCGAKTPIERCIMCFHDFGGPDGKLPHPLEDAPKKPPTDS